MNQNDYERLLADRAATVRYHVGHIKLLQAQAEACLLVGDLERVRLCLEDSRRHLEQIEEGIE